MYFLVYIIIGILLFSIIRKVIGKLFPNLKSANFLISGIFAVGITPIISKVILILLFNLILYEYHPNRKFNLQSWNENIQDRHQMLNNLIESQILINKTKKQLADEFGIPESKVHIENDTLSNWTYNMGSRSWGFGLKFYYLDIEFENGKSKLAKIREEID